MTRIQERLPDYRRTGTGARLLPRGQLELRVNQELPDPTRRILTCCELGHVSTLAASTLREMGFLHTVALDGRNEGLARSRLPARNRSRYDACGAGFRVSRQPSLLRLRCGGKRARSGTR